MKKKITIVAALLAVFSFSLFSMDAKYTKEYAENLLKTVDRSMYPEIYKSVVIMTTVRAGREPLSNTFEVFSRGADKSLMKITAPARDKGKKILLNGDNLWMFMPDISRPIRLSAKENFMGSTFPTRTSPIPDGRIIIPRK